MYVYRKTEQGLYSVGFHSLDGTWHSESTHDDSEKAAERVAWLDSRQNVKASTPKKGLGLDMIIDESDLEEEYVTTNLREEK